ncbi:hypothetical protein Ae201684P_016619 [Aphanomyces euteiches]|nr:hypothetical protein Ae201684P_016619 [Aphanomyces euteiches]
MTKSTFPLPRDFFRSPPLSAGEVRRFIQLGEQSCKQIHYSKIKDGPIAWTLESAFDNTQVYSGKNPQAPPQVAVWCGATQIRATIEEVVYRLKTESTDEYIEEVPRRRSLNTATTATLTCCEFKIDGRRGWVLAFKSIVMPNCPDLHSALGIVRANIFCGSVFLESVTRPGYLDYVRTWHLDCKGKIPKWLYSRSIKLRCIAMRNFSLLLQESRLRGSIPTLLPNEELVSHSDRSKCFACSKTFHFLSTKQNCRACGEVMCRNCIRWFDNKEARVSLCVSCSVVPVNEDEFQANSASHSGSLDADEAVLTGSQATDSDMLNLSGVLKDLSLVRSTDGNSTVPSFDDSVLFHYGSTIHEDETPLLEDASQSQRALAAKLQTAPVPAVTQMSRSQSVRNDLIPLPDNLPIGSLRSLSLVSR